MRVGLLVLLCGCADIEVLAPGECGNGVIEAGEDCDRFAAAGQECGDAASGAGACHFVCEPAACPAGWACRRDGVCHHATGRFSSGSDISVAADDLMVADMDGDEALDLVAISGAALRVYFGDGQGGFGDELVRVLPLPLTGRLALGDLDGDGRSDVAVPYSDGVALLAGRRDRSLDVLPVAAYPALDEWLVPFRAFGPSPEEELFGLDVIGDPPDVVYEAWSIPTLDHFGPQTLTTLPVDFDPHVAVDDDDGDGNDEILLGIGDGELRRCDSSRPLLPGDPMLVSCSEVLDRGELRLTGRALFAKATRDGELDVIAEVEGGRVAVLPGDGAGAHGTAAVDDELSVMGMPLAAGDLDGDGATDWVTSSAVFLARLGPEQPLLSFPPQTIREALVVPLSAGASPDVVLAGDDGVTVLLNDGEGLFTERAIPSAGTPFSLRTGSFDGDRIGDVVWGEHLPGGRDALLLLFGEEGSWPTGPVRVAGLAGIEHIETGLVRGNSGTYDGATDIFVSTAAGPDGMHAVAAFTGAGDRNLNAPLALPIIPEFYFPEAVFAGTFLQRSTSGDDLVAVGRERDSGAVRLFIAGAEPDAIFRADRVASAPLEDSAPAGCATAWAAGDRDGNGTKELVELDCRGTLRTLRVEAPDAASRFVEIGRTELPSPPAGEFRTELADLDGDGRADVVATDDDGVRIVWADPERAITFVAARAVARLSAGGDGAVELAVLSDRGVFVGRIEDGLVSLGETAAVTGSQMAVGDLDGDGLDDVVVSDGSRLVVLLAESHLAARAE